MRNSSIILLIYSFIIYSFLYRERNRILARETRRKNKNEFEQLQRDADLLRYENRVLRQSIKEVLESLNSGDDTSMSLESVKEALSGLQTERAIGTGTHDYQGYSTEVIYAHYNSTLFSCSCSYGIVW